MKILIDSLRPIYAFTDPHGGSAGPMTARLKRVASQAAICVGGIDHLDRLFVLDAWAGRISTDDLIEKMYETCEKWHVKTMGGEANGLQALFQDAVIRDAKLRGRRLPLLKVLQPTHQQKDFRIRTALQPRIGNGKLFIARHLTELVAQIVGFPLSPQKDLIDCLASLCRLIPPKPVKYDRDAELQAKLKYLRDTGAHPMAIDEAARGH